MWRVLKMQGWDTFGSDFFATLVQAVMSLNHAILSFSKLVQVGQTLFNPLKQWPTMANHGQPEPHESQPKNIKILINHMNHRQ
jgi:hypothetical protein